MTKTADIVSQAFRKLGITGQGETLEAEELNEGLAALNNMLFAWKLAGVDTGHVELTATSEFPLDPEYREGTIYSLAMRISPNFEVPQGFDADDFFRKIQAAYASTAEMAVDTVLTRLPSQESIYR